MGTKEAAGKTDDEGMVGGLKALLDKDTSENGVCIDNFPRSAGQAEKMKEMGVMPDLVVVVEVEQQVIIDWHARRVVDPETGTLYDTKTNPPPAELAEKCTR